MTRWGRPVTRTRTREDKLTGLRVALGNSSDAALARFTPDELVRWHGTDVKTAEYELICARQRRERGRASK